MSVLGLSAVGSITLGFAAIPLASPVACIISRLVLPSTSFVLVFHMNQQIQV